MGVASGTLITAAVEISLIVLPYAFHVLNVKPSRFFREALLPAIMPSLPMVVFLYVILIRIEFGGIVSLMTTGLAATLLYALFYLMFPTNSAERKIFIDFKAALRKRINRKFS